MISVMFEVGETILQFTVIGELKNQTDMPPPILS